MIRNRCIFIQPEAVGKSAANAFNVLFGKCFPEWFTAIESTQKHALVETNNLTQGNESWKQIYCQMSLNVPQKIQLWDFQLYI